MRRSDSELHLFWLDHDIAERIGGRASASYKVTKGTLQAVAYAHEESERRLQSLKLPHGK